jgi:hypothetical protein
MSVRGPVASLTACSGRHVLERSDGDSHAREPALSLEPRQAEVDDLERVRIAALADEENIVRLDVAMDGARGVSGGKGGGRVVRDPERAPDVEPRLAAQRFPQ